MKRCPACQRTYADDSLSYCLEDGSQLFSDSSTNAASDMAATLIIPEPRATIPVKQETFRPTPTPPHDYPAPQPPAWPPVAPMQMQKPVTAGAQPGRGLAVTSLVCAIAAYLLLGFCIIAGASGVEATLIGGIFIVSAFIALIGAVLGIVALARSSKDTGVQNAKTISVVALVLNGLYLLISIVFLILGAAASSR